MRLLAIGVALAAAIGGMTAGSAPAAQAEPMNFVVPLPHAPAPSPPSDQNLPSTGQVNRILAELTDPGVSNQVRDGLVQGGIDTGERRAFTSKKLTKATKRGELPLSFTVGNIWPVGPNTAAAQVTLAGPKLSPAVEVFTFIDQGGWMLSSDSAATLIQTVAQD